MLDKNLTIKIAHKNTACNMDNFEDTISTIPDDIEFLLIVDRKTKRRFCIPLLELK